MTQQEEEFLHFNSLLTKLEENLNDASSAENIQSIRSKFRDSNIPISRKRFINKNSKKLLDIDTQLEEKLQNNPEFLKKLKILQIGTILSFLTDVNLNCDEEVQSIINIYENKIQRLNESIQEINTAQDDSGGAEETKDND